MGTGLLEQVIGTEQNQIWKINKKVRLSQIKSAKIMVSSARSV